MPAAAHPVPRSRATKPVPRRRAIKPVPRYRAIKQAIAGLLRDGKWKHGQAIPSEPQLAARFDASIGTVRKAIDGLVDEGILVREQGRGTFVRSHTRDTMLEAFFNFVDAHGIKELPQVELLGFRRARCDRPSAERLGVAPGSAVLRMRHVLSLRGVPTLLDDIRMPAALVPGLTAQDLAERHWTIYALLQRRYGLTVVRVEEAIAAVPADADAAQHLRVRHGTPLLHITRTAFAYGGRAVDTRVRRVRTGAWTYRSVLGR
jgi:GntR family transcriptional regulator